MANPLFNALGGGQQSPMMRNFGSFMHKMRGNNPNQMISQFVQSGQLSQEQLNMVQEEYQRIKEKFDGMRGMFGF